MPRPRTRIRRSAATAGVSEVWLRSLAARRLSWFDHDAVVRLNAVANCAGILRVMVSRRGWWAVFGDTSAAGGDEPTPAELRDLQARADTLARDIARARDRLKRQPGLPRGVRGALPRAVDEAVAQAARQLGIAAGSLARVRAAQWAGSCTAWWGICPRCGPTLRSQDGRSWCQECGARWGYDRSQGPCGEPGDFVAMDELGGAVVVCAAHGQYMQERLDGGLLLAIPRS